MSTGKKGCHVLWLPNAKLTSGGLKAKDFQKAEKVLRWKRFEKPHYTSRLS
jgi:hypothetical protein